MVLMATLFLKERLTCNVYKVLVWFSDWSEFFCLLTVIS
jgi:hypothetical protein